MEGQYNTKDTLELISETVTNIIAVAVEHEIKLRSLSNPLIVVQQDADGVIEQLNGQLDSYKRELDLVIRHKVEIIDKLVGFREKLKIRHTKAQDNVLAKYDEFFGLKEA